MLEILGMCSNCAVLFCGFSVHTGSTGLATSIRTSLVHVWAWPANAL